MLYILIFLLWKFSNKHKSREDYSMNFYYLTLSFNNYQQVATVALSRTFNHSPDRKYTWGYFKSIPEFISFHPKILRDRSEAMWSRAAREHQPASWCRWQVLTFNSAALLYLLLAPPWGRRDLHLTLPFLACAARRLPGHSLELPGAAEGGGVCAGEVLSP